MINLFYNYYKDKNPLRQIEIDYCFFTNLNNSKLNVIILNIESKLTYDYYFNQINKISMDDDINIICNSDIYFDESIENISKIKHDECYALLRYEDQGSGNIKFKERPDSQDSWIFRGKIKNVIGNFELGVAGCDNKIAYNVQAAGYKVLNPARDVKSFHLHNSNVRNYNPRKPLPGPYLTIHPTGLYESNIL